MKDMYSFSLEAESHNAFYELSKTAYLKVYARVGLGDKTFITFASGGIFSKYSHEFQTLTDVGEDTIYLSREKNIAINKEVYNDEVLAELGLKREDLEEVRAVEVGNIFPLGTRFAESAGLTFEDKDGSRKYPVMGSYGIGISRLMGVIVETLSDEKGIVWPETVAPFKVHLLTLQGGEAKGEELYQMLTSAGIEVLFDDRDLRPGEKFADSDLIGIPHRLVVSTRSIEAGGTEYKKRTESEGKVMSFEEVVQMLKNN
jgi:prolyl-tRNA synthetase